MIKFSSYTENFPKENCVVKVAIKPNEVFQKYNPKWFSDNSGMKMFVCEEAIYEDGFVTLQDGYSYLATNFLFHKLKRSQLKNIA